ncbi:HalOD1 output domain-containing protein [Halomicrococcus gelatinilyticus]|uniref:HalOD1 output domain-containing protein n=1 Tax=Halomicrococcus gelatinilyticus TaxID=1702103 RepID=UPI002E0D7AB5
MSDTEKRLSEAVLRAISDFEGIDEAEGQPLYETVDLDALDDLFRTDSGQVTFQYVDHVVTVTSDGDVRIEPTDDH